MSYRREAFFEIIGYKRKKRNNWIGKRSEACGISKEISSSNMLVLKLQDKVNVALGIQLKPIIQETHNIKLYYIVIPYQALCILHHEYSMELVFLAFIVNLLLQS